jgi:hypothetical protein
MSELNMDAPIQKLHKDTPIQKRMKKLYDYIEEHGKDFSAEQLIALHCIQEGTSERTLHEYLATYITARVVMEYGDQVVTAEQYLELSAESSRRLRELSDGDKT